jgi:hypothetical protein
MMTERRTASTSESTQAAVLAANFANDRAVIATQRIMDHVGIDPAAEERHEVPLAGSGLLAGPGGKYVSRVIRSLPIPRALAGNGSGVRVVEARDEFHIKRGLVPSFLGRLAYSVSSHSVFYTEATTPAGSATLAAATPDARMYGGHVGPEASEENIARGVEATTDFITQLREVMMASCLSWPQSLIEPVQALSSEA